MDLLKVRRASARSDVRDHPEVAHKVVAEDAAGRGNKGDEGVTAGGVGVFMLTDIHPLLGGNAGAGDGSVGDEVVEARSRVRKIVDRVSLTTALGRTVGGEFAVARMFLRVASSRRR